MQRHILRWRTLQKSEILETDREARQHEFYSDYQAVLEEDEFLRKNMTLAQMIICLKATFEYKKFVVILDNVDRMNGDLQSILFSVAIDIYHGGEGSFGVVVAVREKNLLRYEVAGTEDDEIEVVSLETRSTERIKPWRLALPDLKFLETLLHKRYRFGEDLAGEAPQGEKVLFQKLCLLIEKGFVEEKIFNIANHDLRALLTLNDEFLTYLFNLAREGVILNDRKDLELSESDFRTFFYRWLYVAANTNHEFLLDISKQYSEHIDHPELDHLRCDLELILLAWLVNCRNRIIRANDIVRDFELIGVDKGLVIDSLFRLYDVQADHRYIDIGDSEAKVSWSEVSEDNPRVLLLPLGREFVESTITKFEFLFHCLAYPGSSTIDSEDMLRPIERDPKRTIELVFEFLEKMMAVHLMALKQVKAKLSQKAPRWEQFYRDRFCIDKQLILERIVVSHEYHFGGDQKTREKYADLLKKYRDEMRSLG